MQIARRLAGEATVPVNAAGAFESVVQAYTGDHSIWILSNPGFLADGTAMKELFNPDRVAFGGHTTWAGAVAAEVLADVYAMRWWWSVVVVRW